MPTAADPQQLIFVSLLQGATEWGVEAGMVERIVSAGDWSAFEPTDVAARLGLPSGNQNRSRVLVVRARAGLIALWAGRSIRFRAHRPAEVLRLPEVLFASGPARELFSGVVVSEAQPPLFVLDISGLESLVNECRGDGAC